MAVTWTKETKEVDGSTTGAGWGDQEWGSSAWGGTQGSTWTKQSKEDAA